MNVTKNLPTPDKDALSNSQQLTELIIQRIADNHGWLPFSTYMEMALYTPRLGYYSGGSTKIGYAGDFITAPSLTPLFGQTLATQIIPILAQTAGHIYEFGAGTGQLAASILQSLHQDQCQHYYIIEVSAELRQRQQQYLHQHAPQWQDKIVYLDRLPELFDGLIIGNELLDAIPVDIYRKEHDMISKMGISWVDHQFQWKAQPEIDPLICHEITTTFPTTDQSYTSELHTQQYAFVSTLAQKLKRGAMLWIDYGFDAAQYYHPQRTEGTLTAHYRHHSIHDVFMYPGLMDITAHVNFTRIADAGIDHDLDLIGYTTQANFLLNLGITELLEKISPTTQKSYIQAANACHQLLEQHEMGELFKVMALGKDIDVEWQGFKVGDICHKL